MELLHRQRLHSVANDVERGREQKKKEKVDVIINVERGRALRFMTRSRTSNPLVLTLMSFDPFACLRKDGSELAQQIRLDPAGSSSSSSS